MAYYIIQKERYQGHFLPFFTILLSNFFKNNFTSSIDFNLDKISSLGLFIAVLLRFLCNFILQPRITTEHSNKNGARNPETFVPYLQI